MAQKRLSDPVNAYHATLRRVPDDVMLAVAAHDFDGGDGERCLCAWVVREALARLHNTDPMTTSAIRHENVHALGLEADDLSAELFGGTVAEWNRIYRGVLGYSSRKTFAAIELAFTVRVMEAAGVA